MYGFVKVCAATPEIKVADVEFNTENIIKAIKISADEGSSLTVFPELCICGYTCGDLLNQSVLIAACNAAVEKICKATVGLYTLVFVGAPVSCYGKLYNCAVVIYNGEVLGVVPKTFIPNYGEFYEKRYFAEAPENNGTVKIANRVVPFGAKQIFKANDFENFTVACEICEDLWSPLSPSANHALAGANIIVNLSCSDEIVGKADYRTNLVKVQSGKLICGYIYCDAGEGESTTDMVFAGHNIIAENGVITAEKKPFESGLLFGEIDVDMLAAERRRTASGYYKSGAEKSLYTETFFTAGENVKNEFKLSRNISKTPFIPDSGISERSELILTIQAKGLAKRIKHTGAKTAVIGISGGLDSALALLVTCRAFNLLGKDKKDIIAVTMPAFGTTKKTKNNSLKLINALGATERIISVSDSVLKHFKDINHDPADKNVTYENAQARMRTMVLMDVANDNNGLVIGTGDLSELALGWATYNGDHMSMYGVNASVPKTLVKYLVGYEAEKIGGACGKVLKEIVQTEISPELLPPDESGNIAQKTEDLVGPYILNDFFLYYAVRYGFEPQKIAYLAGVAFENEFDGKTILKWLKNFYKRFFSQQFKRSCVPDGVKIGSVALSPRGDWRMPSDAAAAVWLDNLK